MDERILLASPHMSDEGYEKEYIKEAFESNWIAPLGENVDKFEIELASYIGVNKAVALSSGTAAIHMALKALGVGKGDIVFCQSLTFIATANPIIYQGAIPVFIDSEYLSFNMSTEALERAFEKYPECKVVIVVHLYGTPANMDKLLEICRAHNATLVEDSCESLGATYKGIQTGSLGEFGTFSFNGNKIITTSGGGALVTNNAKAAEKVRFWSTQSKEKTIHYEHLECGYNYRMSNILAGIGRGQLKVLDKRIAKKKEIYDFYKEAFEEIPEIKMQPIPEDTKPNHWLSAIYLDKKLNINPIEIIEKLKEKNIESRPIWKPMHLQPVFKDCDFVLSEEESVAEDLYNRGLCLPSDTKMTLEEQSKVIYIVKEEIKCIKNI